MAALDLNRVNPPRPLVGHCRIIVTVGDDDLATGDGRLVVWANDGDLGLVESAQHSPTAYKELVFKQGIGKSEAWPHVVLAGGRLFCKDRSGRLWSAPVR